MNVTVDRVRSEVLKVDPEYADAVSQFDIEVREDSTGDPGIFVTIVFKDREIFRAWPMRNEYRTKVQDLLFREWPDWYPYVTFSAESVAIDPEKPTLA